MEIIELKNLNKLSNNVIKEDLNSFDKSNLILEILLGNTDALLIKEFEKRIKGIDINLYLNVFRYINEYKIKHLEIPNSISSIGSIDLFETVEIPVFPIESLPDIISEFVKSVANSTQTSLDMGAIASLGILSTCLQGSFKVKIKDGWIEPINLYLTLIALPAERKSAIFSVYSKPLIDFEISENIKLKSIIEQSKIEKSLLEKQKMTIINGKKLTETNKSELTELAEKLSNFKETKPIQVFADDVTPEKLTSLLAENDGKMSILSAEGGIFDVMSGKYNPNTINIDVFLKSHAGDTLKVDRIGRLSEVIMSPTLTMFLAIQPSILNEVIKNPNFFGRGLTARFLYSYPKSLVGTRKFYTDSVPESIKENYETLIKTLLENKPKVSKLIEFNKDAQSKLKEFSDKIETSLLNDLNLISGWAGKLVGTTARIACLLQIIKDYTSLEVDRETVESAINISNYFLEHAKNIFIYSNINPNVQDALYILEYLKKNYIFSVNYRELLRGRRKFNSIKDMANGLSELIERKYIFYDKENKKFLLNPSAL